jgi:hypothetical protein
MDIDARIQLFDYKTKYQFVTIPGVDQYNMPLYAAQSSSVQNEIAPFPLYQGFMGPAFVNGIEVPFYTERKIFDNLWPSYLNQLQVAAIGDGGDTYTLNLPYQPNSSSASTNPLSAAIIRGHIDLTGQIALINTPGAPTADPPVVTDGTYIPDVPFPNINSRIFFTTQDSTGANVIVQDSGFLLDTNINCGLLMVPGSGGVANAALSGGYSTTQNTINYLTGVAQNVTFPAAIPLGNQIMSSCVYWQLGLPRAILFFDNVLTLRAPPNTQYVVEIDAYLTPAAFLSTSNAIPFGYMSEYISRGAARKILSDTGDWDQFNAYEPLFKEQEDLVWKRSQRQFTSTRTQTIYSARGLGNNTGGGFGGIGGF